MSSLTYDQPKDESWPGPPLYRITVGQLKVDGWKVVREDADGVELRGPKPLHCRTVLLLWAGVLGLYFSAWSLVAIAIALLDHLVIVPAPRHFVSRAVPRLPG